MNARILLLLVSALLVRPAGAQTGTAFTCPGELTNNGAGPTIFAPDVTGPAMWAWGASEAGADSGGIVVVGADTGSIIAIARDEIIARKEHSS